MVETETFWHIQTAETVAGLLKTDLAGGLSATEAKERLAAVGPNRLEDKARVSPLAIFAAQFNDFMIWVLIAAALISGFVLREQIDALAITAILILNALLGFRQEVKAEKALEALRKLAAPSAKVIRDGAERQLAAAELVPGDLIVIEAGDHVPADARLVEASSLLVNESSLTGESKAAAKTTGTLSEVNLALGDRTNLIFMGTNSVAGRGRALVYATGAGTQMGEISRLLQQPEEKTPLQIELHNVGKAVALLALAISGVVFAFGYGVRGFEPSQIFLTGVALAVAAIPEGLPAVVTVALALGVQAMAKRHVIIRKLHAVETLGSTSFICTDKTGTLTENRMTLSLAYVNNSEMDMSKPDSVADPALKELLSGAVLCNDARFGAGGELLGDPTETALIQAAHDAGLDVVKLRQANQRLNEIPFDSERKQMLTVNSVGETTIAFAKGAPEKILAQSTMIMRGGREEPLTAADKEKLNQVNDRLAAEGYRIMAFARRRLDVPSSESDLSGLERGLTFIGFAGLQDPPRPQVKAALELCRDASIQVAMVTGDHRLTAESIARQIGLFSDSGESAPRVLTGVELAAMSEDELAAIVEEVKVYARVAPADKVKIVNALRKRGHIVAMTGDGVNDAPAVKRADIGVAMGVVGTDVTKEAADMVLTDDNFASIVSAVEEGRLIFNNLRKFILFLLSCNVSEVLTLLIATMSGFLPIPLLPVQLLWINLVTDGLPALALGVDPPAPELMKFPPRPRSEGILTRHTWTQVISWGLAITAGVMGVFIASLYLFKLELAQVETLVFTTMVLGQLLHTFNFRVEAASVFSRRIFHNKPLLLAVGASTALQLGVVYFPPAQAVFKTVAISLWQWGLVLAGAFFPLVAIDITKRFGALK